MILINNAHPPPSRSQHFLQPESEEQDPGLPAPFLRSPKENGDAGGAADTKDDSKDEAAAAADTDADPARLPSGSGGRHRVSFPERYAGECSWCWFFF